MRLQNKGVSNWEARSIEAIVQGLAECEVNGIDLDRCKQWISKNKYPFGVRANHPYKVWTKELKILDEFLSLDIPFFGYRSWRSFYRKPRKTRKERNDSRPEQMELFSL